MVIRYTLLLLLLPSLCFGAIAERASVKATKGGVSANSTTLAFANNVGQGDLLVIGGTINENVSLTAVTATDTLSTSYTCLLGTLISGGGSYPFLCYGIAPAAGANTVTVNPDESSNLFDFAIDAFTGVSPSAPLDGALSCSTAGSGPGALSINHTTNSANALLLGIYAQGTGDSTTPGATFTQIGENETSIDGFNFQFKVLAAAAGVHAVDWSSINVAYSACSISFKEPGSARRPIAPMVLQ